MKTDEIYLARIDKVSNVIRWINEFGRVETNLKLEPIRYGFFLKKNDEYIDIKYGTIYQKPYAYSNDGDFVISNKVIYPLTAIALQSGIKLNKNTSKYRIKKLYGKLEKDGLLIPKVESEKPKIKVKN